MSAETLVVRPLDLDYSTNTMPRMFIVFRTLDRIWDSAMFTREFAHLEMDTSCGGIQLIFQTDNNCCHSKVGSERIKGQNIANLNEKRYYEPHRNHQPLLFGQQNLCLQNQSLKSFLYDQSVSVASYSSSKDNSSICKINVESSTASDNSKCVNSTHYFVLPVNKCTIVVDAHLAASFQNEFAQSKAFRCRLFREIRKTSGFRNCTPDYQNWSQNQQEAWDNYLSIPFMLDVIAVWPWQKIDFAWSDRILTLHHKHVALEESLAWLSTLGGAHSSLGETFLDHAEKAGEISMQQLRLARELDNEVMIARCFLYWAWSLMQRNYLARCKVCILNTWGYVQKMRCCDRVLINMCRAVWSRLQYKRTLKARARCYSKSSDATSRRDSDGSGCGLECSKGTKYPSHKAFNGSRMQMQQSVQVF